MNNYCSHVCLGRSKRQRRTIDAIRQYCGEPFTRPAYDGPRQCASCGYALRVDIAHIRDVADFADTSTVAEVNDPANLVALDKTCHWEFDHGYLTYVDGRFVARQGLEP